MKRFSRTIDDGTNDLVDLAILGGLGTSESLAESWCESWLDGLQGSPKRCWSPEGGSSERPGDAAVWVESARVDSHYSLNVAPTNLLSILRDL